MVSNMKIRRESRRVCLDEVVFNFLDEHLAGLIGRSTIRSGSQSAFRSSNLFTSTNHNHLQSNQSTSRNAVFFETTGLIV